MNPDKILRNLDHGYFMTHEEQTEAAAYIRQLQQAVLDEREACARLCDDISEGLVGDDVDGAWGAGHCARAIEARSKHDTNK